MAGLRSSVVDERTRNGFIVDGLVHVISVLILCQSSPYGKQLLKSRKLNCLRTH